MPQQNSKFGLLKSAQLPSGTIQRQWVAWNILFLNIFYKALRGIYFSILVKKFCM